MNSHRPLRPDTGDGRSLPCVSCGTKTPDASWCCGLPYCDNCMVNHASAEDALHGQAADRLDCVERLNQLWERVRKLEAQRDKVLAACDQTERLILALGYGGKSKGLIPEIRRAYYAGEASPTREQTRCRCPWDTIDGRRMRVDPECEIHGGTDRGQAAA